MTLPRSSLPTLLLQAATLVGVGALGFLAVRNQDEVQALRSRWEAAEQQLQILAGEMTRYRLEQRAEGKGVDAVLEKLKAAFQDVLEQVERPAALKKEAPVASAEESKTKESVNTATPQKKTKAESKQAEAHSKATNVTEKK